MAWPVNLDRVLIYSFGVFFYATAFNVAQVLQAELMKDSAAESDSSRHKKAGSTPASAAELSQDYRGYNRRAATGNITLTSDLPLI